MLHCMHQLRYASVALRSLGRSLWTCSVWFATYQIKWNANCSNKTGSYRELLYVLDPPERHNMYVEQTFVSVCQVLEGTQRVTSNSVSDQFLNETARLQLSMYQRISFINIGRPRSSFKDVALRDCQKCRISRPYRDAQDRLLWRDKTRPART